jgi:hypothetical protein
MTRPASKPTVGSEFDEFLYASIGVEKNGMLLSVLSALARLNVDPWDEASRLARLPREATMRFLANLIAAQPDGSSARADPEGHAKRLAELLPQSTASGIRSSEPIDALVTSGRPAFVRYAIYYIIVATLFFGAQWFTQRLRQPTHSSAGALPTSSVMAPPSAPVTAPIRN